MNKNPFSQKCTATSSQTGEPCKKYAITGSTVCEKHGGRAPQVRSAARRRVLQYQADEIIKKLDLPDAKPVEDPVSALMWLAGETEALVRALKLRVAELDSLSNGSGHWGDMMAPEMAAYISSIRECERVLSSLARLNLSERMIRLDEARAELVAKLIERVLRQQGIDTTSIDVRASIAQQMERLAA